SRTDPVLQLADLLQADASLRSKVSITCAGKRDGGGSQSHAIMSPIAFGKAMGVSYIHSPFVQVSHSPSDAADWTNRWDRFFSFGSGEQQVGAVTVPIEAFLANPRIRNGGATVLVARTYHEFLNRDPDLYASVF